MDEKKKHTTKKKNQKNLLHATRRACWKTNEKLNFVFILAREKLQHRPVEDTL